MIYILIYILITKSLINTIIISTVKTKTKFVKAAVIFRDLISIKLRNYNVTY